MLATVHFHWHQVSGAITECDIFVVYQLFTLRKGVWIELYHHRIWKMGHNSSKSIKYLHVFIYFFISVLTSLKCFLSSLISWMTYHSHYCLFNFLFTCFYVFFWSRIDLKDDSRSWSEFIDDDVANVCEVV